MPVTTKCMEMGGLSSGRRMGNVHKIPDGQFEEWTGLNAEAEKKDVVGKRGSRFDFYYEKGKPEIFLMRKGGRGQPIETGLSIPSGFVSPSRLPIERPGIPPQMRPPLMRLPPIVP